MTTAPRAWQDPILIVILLGSLVLNTHRVGHAGVRYFDESFHAIVARNLLKHPLKPTLIDVPYLPYDLREWGENHVWLHKPILPLWTIAASYALLGVNTMALRLPSALLATASVGLTFLIGRRLFDRPTALIASAFQAINPAITMLLQGYLFSDHIDIALLFWVEVGVYFLARAVQTGSKLSVLAVGVAQGLAYLSKSYLAALLTGLAITAWMLPRVGLVSAGESKLKARHILGLIAATLATIAPWTIYCAWNFPVEFQHEHGYVFTHLGQGVENWGAPWDRLFFDYLTVLYHGLYTPLIVAAVALLGSAFATRRMPLLFLYAWMFGVIAPHAISATKTPSATLIAMPAGFLLLAHLIAEGCRGRIRPLVAWASIMVIGAIRTAPIVRFGKGYPNPPSFGGVMFQASWVLEHLALALVVVATFEGLAWCRSRNFFLPSPSGRGAGGGGRGRSSEVEGLPSEGPSVGRQPSPRGRGSQNTFWSQGLRTLAVASTLLISARVAKAAWDVADLGSENLPFVVEMADFARGRLPSNAVLLFEGPDLGEKHLAMFLLDRTSYHIGDRPVDEVARQVREAGGLPFVVTAGTVPWPRRFASKGDPRALYEWQGSAVATRASDRPR